MISAAGRLALAAVLRGSVRSPKSTVVQACALATTQKMTEWHWLKERGIEVNPCNSRLHPAVQSGAFEVREGTEELPVQEAYTPNSSCYGCGPAAEDGLHLKSFRADKGLVAKVTFPHRYQAFPGIINGGVLSTAFDCHGNWTAAISLMDKKRLPRPPLTLTAELLVQFLEPAPPDQQLVLTSQVSDIYEHSEPSGQKESVEVVMQLSQVLSDGSVKEVAKATGQFKKMGALRAI